MKEVQPMRNLRAVLTDVITCNGGGYNCSKTACNRPPGHHHPCDCHSSKKR